MILSIDTSTEVCSVALSDEGKTLKSLEYSGAPNHASRLAPMIAELMDQACLSYRELEAVAVSSGPGSYTGLRIGVSTAKGIAYAAGLKLIAVPTLSVMARAIFDADPECRMACPMIDARRMEVYTTIIGRDGQIILPTAAVVIDEESFGTELAHNEITFGGNGSDKCRGILASPNARFVAGIRPLAADMAKLAHDKLAAGQVESVAYFEPLYLKEFVATTPKNKVLNY